MLEIKLSGPGKNALSLEMMDFILAKLNEAVGRPILLTGEGDAFSAGLNLKQLASLDDTGMEAFLRKLEALVDALYTHPMPTVAYVNGHAIAGGCILALCCDHRVAAANPNIKIGLNELALGLAFPPVTLSVIRERLPRRHMNQVLLGAQLSSPLEALRLGLVDEVAENADGVARERLAALSQHPPAAYARMKAELRDGLVGIAQDEHQFHELLPLWTSAETRRRLEATLKR